MFSTVIILQCPSIREISTYSTLRTYGYPKPYISELYFMHILQWHVKNVVKTVVIKQNIQGC